MHYGTYHLDFSMHTRVMLCNRSLAIKYTTISLKKKIIIIIEAI